MPKLDIEGEDFSPLRKMLWPVHGYELKKLIPMLLIFFLISFDYNILRVIKDTLVVTPKTSGAEAIPFIDWWVMFPGALMLTALYAWLSNRMKQEHVFYLMMGIFFGFYTLFTFVLYPNREALQPDGLADFLQGVLPVGCKGVIAMVRHWMMTLFYAMSELWSNIVLCLLFWGFANRITRLGEAKRFYGLFGIGANLSGIFAGTASAWICKRQFDTNLPFGCDAWDQSLMILMGLILASGVVIFGLYRWIHTSLMTDPRFYDQEQGEKDQPVKQKLSLTESLSYLVRSPYLLSIAAVVLSYNIVINLVEVLWKQQVRELFPNPNDYQIYMSHVTAFIGIVATMSALLVSGNSIRRFGWTFTAMITPMILFITSVGFFFFLFTKGSPSDIIFALTGMKPLALVVFFGTCQSAFSRSAKYSVFDATKEMAYVPLSTESKIKGKAAIDGVCSRLGKSGGAMIHQGFLLMFGSLTASAPYVAACLFLIIGVWALAVRTLGAHFNAMTKPVAAPMPEKNETVELVEQQA